MRLRPALVLAAPVGVLGGHAIGYLAAPDPAGPAAVHHGYLALVLAVAVPLALLGLAYSAATVTVGGATPVARRRRRGGTPGAVPVGPLLLAQWVLFTGQEVVEHALAGHGAAAVLHSPAVWCGLAAQVLTASAAVLLLRASGTAAAHLLAGATHHLHLALPLAVGWLAPGPAHPPFQAAPTDHLGRAPPAVRFA